MERVEEELMFQNNDPTMSDSAQPRHQSEVCLTIMASDHSNTEIVADSDINPDNLHSSNYALNRETNGGTSVVSLTPLYYSPPLTKHKTGKSSSSSSADFPFRSFGNNDETVWYPEDWGGNYSGDLMAQVRNNQKGDSGCSYPRPEKQLIDFGLRLVILDKTLSGVRMLAFIWATVVLLGGFASMLKKIDFWFVTTIIFIVGTGIFSRNHQLESRFFFQAAKVISGKIGMIITILQLLFAGVSVAFSMTRLVKQGYNGNNEQTNMQASLNIFYAVALTHALLFLSEKAYWFWTVSYIKIIEEVCYECGFGTSGKVSLRRFFHETYWKLSKGSVFQALDLDLITFAEGLLLSNSRGDQLIAVRILNGLIRHNKFSEDTCRRIRTSTITTNRMVSMLSWHDQGAEAIRTYAAQIVAGVASELQVESIPEAINCISSLLALGHGASFELNLLGLVILRNLASNPLNCMKITQRTDLLSKIVQLTKCNAHILDRNEVIRLKMVKRSLKLLKKMVSTKGKAGQIIRQDISQISGIVNNLRDILLYGGTDFVLFKLTVKILAALAMRKPFRKQIASTDGIIRLLVTIFLKSSRKHNETRFWSKAGKSLAVLTVQSKRICSEILRENVGVVQKITVIICTEDVYQSTIAMRILRNICAYSGPKWLDNLKQVITALPWVLNTIMSPDTPEELLEASIGLCVQISKFASIEEFTRILASETHFSIIRVADMLLTILQENIYPNAQFPCLRRHTIELILWITESDDHLIKHLKGSGMEKVLAKTAETTAEFENFHYFSDNFGVMKYPKTMSSLVSKARIMVR